MSDFFYFNELGLIRFTVQGAFVAFSICTAFVVATIGLSSVAARKDN